MLAAAAAETRLEERDFTTLSLEDLGTIRIPTVVGASKHEQKTTEAPASVSIVTRDDIQKFGYRTLTDILRSLRGVYATSDQIYHYIGMRGINRPGDYGGRTLLTVNGHRLNDPLYDSTYNGHELPLDVDLIERVEVIRGPGSALYQHRDAGRPGAGRDGSRGERREL
jgi:outer membrane receptor for ferrienterochelin and colicins